MKAGRRMKAEMMRTQRKHPPATLEDVLAAADITDNDKAEVLRFAAFLADKDMPLAEQIEKHGAKYLGFTPEEVAIINQPPRKQP